MTLESPIYLETSIFTLFFVIICLIIKLLDNFEWKETDECNLYDWKYIKYLTQLLKELRETEKFMRLIHVIRSHSVRNLGNIIDSSLYLKSFSGTKNLIEAFHKEV